ncbi:MAG: HAD-IIIC family phosphatase [Sedimentisphaerales bacterium]|nr:HAD-IIIC family phosphatase [Sedimentisphaerales bacterium]
MKLNLCFLGGCEFEYIIHELKSNPGQYFDFNYFYTFEHRGQTNPYNFLTEHGNEVLHGNFDAFIISQHDMMMSPITQIQLNRVTSRQQQEDQLQNLISQAELMIITLSQLNVPILMQFFPWFRTNMLNRFKQPSPLMNEDQFMRNYLTALEELATKYPNFYVLNLTNVCAMHGFKNTMKPMDAPWYSHLQFPANYIAQEFKYYIDFVLHRTKKVKCVIVDLDNTMWNGIIRNVGIENVQIRIDKERFRWNVLAILHARGILVGVISKNDSYLENDIRALVKEQLSGTEFVCFVLNWNDKWQNLQQVQQHLNIGLDSIVFIDDNQFEREQMKAMLPEVRVFDENIFESMLYMPEFQPEQITYESKKRTRFYIEENQRKQAQGNESRDEFLKQCDFAIQIDKMQPYHVDRVTELVQRTNQLNTSIKRYTKEQIISFSHQPNCDIFTVNVADKFGDYGLVGVCIAFGNNDIYEIDTLLFSCRVMSRGIEDYTLTSLLKHAKNSNFDKAVLQFEKGPKNEQMRTILSNNNFKQTDDNNNQITYTFDLTNQQIKPYPEWLSPEQTTSQQELLSI